MRNSRASIGNALDQLTADVKDHARALATQSRAQPQPYKAALLKQAVDTPHRARAQVQAWIVAYNAANGAGTAQTFLAQCLTAAGSSKTLAQIDNALAALETQAQTVVTNVAQGWTWDQVADWIEANVSPDANPGFTYERLPIPANYTTVWGESW